MIDISKSQMRNESEGDAELIVQLQQKLRNASTLQVQVPDRNLVSVALRLARDTTLDLRRTSKVNGIAGEAQARVLQYAQQIIRENLAPGRLDNLGMWSNLNATAVKLQAAHECWSRSLADRCSLPTLHGWSSAATSTTAAKRFVVNGAVPAVGRALSLKPPRVRAYSSVVSDSRHGRIRFGRDRVIKQFDPSTALHEERYYMEKRALCRLERCATPCAGRTSYFPRLIQFNDAALTLVISMEGSPLTVKVDDIVPLYHKWEDLRLNGTNVEQQFTCMRDLLAKARVIHYDVQCKNVFAKLVQGVALLTLGDFDASSVDGTPTRTTDRRRHHAPLGWNRCSLNEQVWTWKAEACFKRDHVSDNATTAGAHASR